MSEATPYRASSSRIETTRPYIGGQAVIEGVMMRSPASFAVVVRRADGSLHVRERPVADGRRGLARLPLARGVAALVESFVLGQESLKFAAEQMERDFAAKEDLERKRAPGVTSALLMALKSIGYTLFLLTTADADPPEPKSEKRPASESPAVVAVEEKKSKLPMTLMIVLMVGLLIALPQAAAAGVNRLLHLGYEVQSPAFQAITGAFKLFIVLGYLLAIRRVPDIKRVFQYHGAEHKTISTYEAGEELNVTNARAKTTLHPRCGTTFLVMVVIVSILTFTFVGGLLPKIETGKAILDNLIFFAVKLPFLPVIAAVTFEIQRVFARYCTTGPLRALLWPGFLCQKITTIEPDDDQLEVALASLRVTLFREKGEQGKTGDVRYASFDALMSSPNLRRAA